MKKVQLSKEELEIQRINEDIEEIRKSYYNIPEPTRLFEIGEEVIIGNLKDCVIEQILDEGKIYVINYTMVNHNYGNPILTPNTKKCSVWFDIFRKSNATESLIRNNDLRLNYMQQEINSLLTKAYYFGVDFRVNYQREFVWEEENKVDLIDSIFNGYDIGKFVFIKKGCLEPNEILDGKQRLSAICDFYMDKFKYKGFYFSELSKKDRDYFRSFPVSVAVIDNISDIDKLRYFKKLNSCGKVMDKEHLNKIDYMILEVEKGKSLQSLMNSDLKPTTTLCPYCNSTLRIDVETLESSYIDLDEKGTYNVDNYDREICNTNENYGVSCSNCFKDLSEYFEIDGNIITLKK